MSAYTIGETTYDILFRNGEPVGACSGGSAYNSAISLGRSGVPVSLVTTFGQDQIGDFSFELLKNNGVNCDLIKRFNGRSRVALAFIDRFNNANYSFYPASEDVYPDYPEPQKNDILLLGSSFALRDNGRECLISFLTAAKKRECIIIYDPNARQCMTDKPELLQKIIENMALATIIKGSDQDFKNIFGVDDGKSAWSHIHKLGNKVLLYTKGGNGAELFSSPMHLEIHAKATKVVSTIGAGDNFSAGIVYGLYQKLSAGITWNQLLQADWEAVMNYGSIFASAVCASSENYIPVETAEMLRS